MNGEHDLCRICKAEARVSGSVEAMLVKRIRRLSSFADPEPAIDTAGLTVEYASSMSEEEAYFELLVRRWPPHGEPNCPKCGAIRPYSLTARRQFDCRKCDHRFSVTSGTMFSARKKSYRDLLVAVAFHGATTCSPNTTSKTAIDVRRRKIANARRSAERPQAASHGGQVNFSNDAESDAVSLNQILPVDASNKEGGKS